MDDFWKWVDGESRRALREAEEQFLRDAEKRLRVTALLKTRGAIKFGQAAVAWDVKLPLPEPDVVAHDGPAPAVPCP